MNKKILLKGALLGCIAVIFGALGAHALKQVLTTDQLLSYETAVRYQIYHAIVLLFLAIGAKWFNNKTLKLSSLFIFWGVVLFSGSIYLLTIKNIFGLAFLKFAGPITPLGGILMIIGWVIIIKEALSRKTN